MKYITYSDGTAVVFSDAITHSSVRNGKFPVGAGFCGIRVTESGDGKKELRVSVSGRSVSMGLGVSAQDETVLTRLLTKSLLN